MVSVVVAGQGRETTERGCRRRGRESGKRERKERTGKRERGREVGDDRGTTWRVAIVNPPFKLTQMRVRLHSWVLVGQGRRDAGIYNCSWVV